MNMDAIATMNDAVGGVKVTVTEDFSKVDPTIPMGEAILRGQQAINYVRTRKNVGDQLNLSRIERQKELHSGLLHGVQGFRTECGFPGGCLRRDLALHRHGLLHQRPQRHRVPLRGL